MDNLCRICAAVALTLVMVSGGAARTSCRLACYLTLISLVISPHFLHLMFWYQESSKRISNICWNPSLFILELSIWLIVSTTLAPPSISRPRWHWMLASALKTLCYTIWRSLPLHLFLGAFSLLGMWRVECIMLPYMHSYFIFGFFVSFPRCLPFFSNCFCLSDGYVEFSWTIFIVSVFFMHKLTFLVLLFELHLYTPVFIEFSGGRQILLQRWLHWKTNLKHVEFACLCDFHHQFCSYYCVASCFPKSSAASYHFIVKI